VVAAITSPKKSATPNGMPDTFMPTHEGLLVGLKEKFVKAVKRFMASVVGAKSTTSTCSVMNAVENGSHGSHLDLQLLSRGEIIQV
jgi:hypothetical protein